MLGLPVLGHTPREGWSQCAAIIIAIAILAAILVMSLVKLWQDRRARARGEEADTQLIGLPAVVGAWRGLLSFSSAW